MYRKKSLYWLKHIDFIIIDIIVLQLCYLLACGFSSNVTPYGTNLYRTFALLLVFGDLLIAVMFNTFKNVLKRGRYVEFTVTFKHTLLLLFLAIFSLFLVKKTGNISRLVVGETFAFYFISTLIVRTQWKKYLLKHNNRNNRVKKTLFVISNYNVVEDVIDNIYKTNFNEYKIIGLCILDRNMKGSSISDIPVTVNKEDCAKYIGKEWIDEVLVITEENTNVDAELIHDLMETGVTLHVNLLPIKDIEGKRQLVEKVASYPVLTITLNYASPLQLALKRVTDIIIGLLGCFVTLILFIFIAPIIYINSPGPIFFGQVRVGKNGKHFKMYKFRSMYLDAEERKKELLNQNKVSDAKMFKMDFDPRIIGNKILEDGTHKTGIGDFIRRTSLDEFPQFYNVLKGDMSFIGTRPPTLDEVELYDLHHYARLAIKPGITGMWQVSGRSDITDFEEVVKLDKEYISNWNPGLDIKIFLKTIQVVLKKQGSV